MIKKYVTLFSKTCLVFCFWFLAFGFVSAQGIPDAFIVEVEPSSFGVNENVDLTIKAVMSNGETVKDYEIQVLHGESAKVVAKVEGNYQRKRIHKFDTLTASAIRLVVYATNGSKTANVFEIRAYT